MSTRTEAMVEPSPIPDVFVSNIGQIEVLDCCCRFTLYVQRGPEREIVARIVMPIDSVPSAIAFTVAQLGGHWIAKPIIPRFLLRAN